MPFVDPHRSKSLDLRQVDFLQVHLFASRNYFLYRAIYRSTRMSQRSEMSQSHLRHESLDRFDSHEATQATSVWGEKESLQRQQDQWTLLEFSIQSHLLRSKASREHVNIVILSTRTSRKWKSAIDNFNAVRKSSEQYRSWNDDDGVIDLLIGINDSLMSHPNSNYLVANYSCGTSSKSCHNRIHWWLCRRCS